MSGICACRWRRDLGGCYLLRGQIYGLEACGFRIHEGGLNEGFFSLRGVAVQECGLMCSAVCDCLFNGGASRWAACMGRAGLMKLGFRGCL